MNFYFYDEGSAAKVVELAVVVGYDFFNQQLWKLDKAFYAIDWIVLLNNFFLTLLLSPPEDLYLVMLQSDLS